MHVPVMPNEVMELLKVPVGGVAVDGTLGLGGHSRLIGNALGSQGRLIAVDQDLAAMAQAKANLADVPCRKDFCFGNFADVDSHLASLHVAMVDAILLDVGISSFQLDDPSRGFAFSSDGPLDMRMNTEQSESAADLVNSYPQDKLAKIITDYGEDRFAKRIAQAIAVARSQKPIERTQELAGIILRALPKGYTRGRIHPATRTFQALRIVVNDELGSLKKALEKCVALLKPGGRLVVISFHSLEDRLVKVTFKRLAQQGTVGLLTKKPMVPTEDEMEKNPRSRSAKLRGVEKLI